jgi:hypothetical protein
VGNTTLLNFGLSLSCECSYCLYRTHAANKSHFNLQSLSMENSGTYNRRIHPDYRERKLAEIVRVTDRELVLNS